MAYALAILVFNLVSLLFHHPHFYP